MIHQSIKSLNLAFLVAILCNYALIQGSESPNPVTDREYKAVVMDGSVDDLKKLFDRGFSPNALIDDAMAFCVTLLYTRRDMTQLFIDRGLGVGLRDCWGRTPLIWTASYGDFNATQALLARGADVMAKDRNGHTALSRATQKRRTEIVNLLNQHIVDQK